MNTLDPSLKIFETLHQLLQTFRRAMRQQLQIHDAELTYGELRILSYVGRNPGCTQTDLVEHSRIDKAQIARTLNHLETQHLINRQHNPDDRRVRQLALSPKGADIFAQLTEQRAQIAKRLLHDLPCAEQKKLLALLIKAQGSPEA